MSNHLKPSKGNITELTSINNQLKIQIKLLLSKLSSFFPPSNETTQNSSNPLSLSTENNKDNTLSDLPYHQQLIIYQNSIELAKAKIKSYNPIQIGNYEMTIKADEERLYNLKSDHDILLNQCNKNNKLLNSSSTLTKLQNDINAKRKVLKEIKDEINILKLAHKHGETKIKDQDKEVIALNDTCLLMRDNIEYRLYNGDNDNIDIGEKIQQLTKKNINFQKDIELEKKEYIKEVTCQQTTIQELQSEIDHIALKLSKSKQKERIINMKEKMRNNYVKLTKDKSNPFLILNKDKTKKRSITPGACIKARLNKSYTGGKKREREKSTSLYKSFIKSRNSYANTENVSTVVVHKQFNTNYDIYNESYMKIKQKRNFSFLNNYSKA